MTASYISSTAALSVPRHTIHDDFMNLFPTCKTILVQFQVFFSKRDCCAKTIRKPGDVLRMSHRDHSLHVTSMLMGWARTFSPIIMQPCRAATAGGARLTVRKYYKSFSRWLTGIVFFYFGDRGKRNPRLTQKPHVALCCKLISLGLLCSLVGIRVYMGSPIGQEHSVPSTSNPAVLLPQVVHDEPSENATAEDPSHELHVNPGPQRNRQESDHQIASHWSNMTCLVCVNAVKSVR